MDHTFTAYLPQDRRRALAEGRELPERATGSVLLADIAGFTRLTSALIDALGTRRGVEALPRHLNRVYDALIADVTRYGGSVTGFSGDGITCWFDEEDGPAAARATACGLAMQQTIAAFDEIPIPDRAPISLTIKVGIASGEVRRVVVGDADIQRFDVLAGRTLTRMAAAEHIARQGEVIVDAATAQALGESLQVQEWHSDTRGQPYAVVAALAHGTPITVHHTLTPTETLPPDALRAWLHDSVAERLQAGQGEFLTELRPAVALFLRFGGIDYDSDRAAREKLDRFIRWVQGLLADYEGTLIQLTMGEKGSYLYAAFGAPIAHEDDARRAVQVALALREPPPELEYVSEMQIGISHGTMRTGAYGSATRRTYGVLGEETNLAARLMMVAEPGQVVASQRVQQATTRYFTWESVGTLPMKGWAEPIPVWNLVGQRQRRRAHLAEPQHALPMVGRDAELTLIKQRLAEAAGGQGQLIGITAEAGMGKSRLLAEVLRHATAEGWHISVGEAESYGTNAPYLVWRGVWRDLFGLTEDDPIEVQIATVEAALEQLGDELLSRLPLLGTVLNLPIPDTDQLRALEAAERKKAREALLVECLRAGIDVAAGGLPSAKADALAAGPSAGISNPPRLIVLEDFHWADSLSRDLLTHIGKTISGLPVAVVLVYRPLAAEERTFDEMAHFTEVALDKFTVGEAEALLRQRLREVGLSLRSEDVTLLVERLTAHAEGNPFYLEELFNYLHAENGALGDPATWGRVTLPNSLHRLILSRLDQLPTLQQRLLKSASIIGRLFQVEWLHGYYPDLGDGAAIKEMLEGLNRLQLTARDPSEVEPSYLFKHAITHEVTYESLTHAMRATLHEQLAGFLEERSGEEEQHLDLLAFHYGRSQNSEKAVHYAMRAGDRARNLYAHEESLRYYEQVLASLIERGALEEAGRTQMKIAQAHHNAFDFERSRGAYETAFELLQQARTQPDTSHPTKTQATPLPPTPRTLRVVEQSEPNTLDPALLGATPDERVIRHLFSTLLRFGPSGEVLPDLAERWEILDGGKRYRFYLREDLRWSDGEPLTSVDVAFAWRRLVDPELNTPGAFELYPIRYAKEVHEGAMPLSQLAVTTAGPFIVEVELSEPCSYFLAALCGYQFAPVPRHVVNAIGSAWAEPVNLVCNGSFQLATWERGKGITLVQNSYFHGVRRGNVERVELSWWQDESSLKAYQAGREDLVVMIEAPREEKLAARATFADECISYSMLGSYSIAFDPNRPPFNDERVRRAFVLALDLERFVAECEPELADPVTGGYLPAAMPGHNTGIALPFAVNEARSLLAAAGYPNGDGFPEVVMSWHDTARSKTHCQYLVHLWQENLRVKVQWRLRSHQKADALTAPLFHIGFVGWRGSEIDPDGALRTYPATWPHVAPDDAVFWQLLDQAQRTFDQSARVALYQQADRLLIERAYVLPLLNDRDFNLMKPWVKQVGPKPFASYTQRWDELSIEPHPDRPLLLQPPFDLPPVTSFTPPTAPTRTLRVVEKHEPLTLDPAMSTTSASARALYHLFSGLVKVGEAAEVLPDLAERWEVLDEGRRYRFYLKEGLRWNDGMPLTSEDVHFAWCRLLDPATASPNAYLLHPIRNASAINQAGAPLDQLGIILPDSRTVEVELEEPCGYFLALLCSPDTGPIPQHVVRAHGAAWAEPRNLVGNGSFQLVSWERGGHLLLERNPHYHGMRRGNVERVEVRWWSHGMSLDDYDAGDVDVMAMLDAPRAAKYEARVRFADECIAGPPVIGSYAIAFNPTIPPFDDERVRRAFVLATDREHFVAQTEEGLALPATGGFVPLGMPGHNPDIALPFAPAQARRLLAEAGYPNGRGFPDIVLWWEEIPRAAAHCQNLIVQWRTNLGIDVTWKSSPSLVQSEDPAFSARSQIQFVGWSTTVLDPHVMLREPFIYYPHLAPDDAYWNLIDEAQRTYNQSVRVALYQQADRMLIERAYVVTLLVDRDFNLVKPWVKSVASRSLGRAMQRRYDDLVIEPH